jgi:hypothetical protein
MALIVPDPANFLDDPQEYGHSENSFGRISSQNGSPEQCSGTASTRYDIRR